LVFSSLLRSIALRRVSGERGTPCGFGGAFCGGLRGAPRL